MRRYRAEWGEIDPAPFWESTALSIAFDTGSDSQKKKTLPLSTPVTKPIELESWQ